MKANGSIVRVLGVHKFFRRGSELRRDIERVMRLAGNDRVGERGAHAPAAGLSGYVVLDIDDAVQRIVDRVIAGAAA